MGMVPLRPSRFIEELEEDSFHRRSCLMSSGSSMRTRYRYREEDLREMN